MKNLFITIVAILISNFVVAQDLTKHKLTVPNHVGEEIPRVNQNFILKAPNDLKTEEKLPLLIWLHGGGAWAEENGKEWPKAANHFWRMESEYSFFILYPQTIGVGWDGASVEVLVKYLLENYPIDPKRVYLSGASMGGAGTWLVANHNPDLYAALVPCMGGGRVRKEILGTVSFDKLKNKPIWAFCGQQDKVTPVEYNIEIDSILHALGGKPKLTIYEKMGHGGPVQAAYKNVDLYKWLMSQKQ